MNNNNNNKELRTKRIDAVAYGRAMKAGNINISGDVCIKYHTERHRLLKKYSNKRK